MDDPWANAWTVPATAPPAIVKPQLDASWPSDSPSEPRPPSLVHSWAPDELAWPVQPAATPTWGSAAASDTVWSSPPPQDSPFAEASSPRPSHFASDTSQQFASADFDEPTPPQHTQSTPPPRLPSPDQFGTFESAEDDRSATPDAPWNSPPSGTHPAHDEAQDWGASWQEGTSHGDEWDAAAAIQQKELALEQKFPRELVQLLISRWDQLTEEWWPDYPATHDEPRDERSLELRIPRLAELVEEVVPKYQLQRVAPFAKTATFRSLQSSLKLTKSLPMVQLSPLSHFYSSKGSTAWESSVKANQIDDDDWPWDTKPASTTASTRVEELTEKKASNRFSFWGRKSTNAPVEAKADTPPVMRTASPLAALARPSLDSVRSSMSKDEPKADAQPRPSADEPSASGEAAPPATSSPSDPPPSAVSRFLGRFGRSKTSPIARQGTSGPAELTSTSEQPDDPAGLDDEYMKRLTSSSVWMSNAAAQPAVNGHKRAESSVSIATSDGHAAQSEAELAEAELAAAMDAFFGGSVAPAQGYAPVMSAPQSGPPPVVTPVVPPLALPSAPSLAPPLAPSLAPSLASSLAPPLAPSLASSLAPPLVPSLASSLAPPLAPSLAPPLAPSLAPSPAPLAPPLLPQFVDESSTLVPTVRQLPIRLNSPLPHPPSVSAVKPPPSRPAPIFDDEFDDFIVSPVPDVDRRAYAGDLDTSMGRPLVASESMSATEADESFGDFGDFVSPVDKSAVPALGAPANSGAPATSAQPLPLAPPVPLVPLRLHDPLDDLLGSMPDPPPAQPLQIGGLFPALAGAYPTLPAPMQASPPPGPVRQAPTASMFELPPLSSPQLSPPLVAGSPPPAWNAPRPQSISPSHAAFGQLNGRAPPAASPPPPAWNAPRPAPRPQSIPVLPVTSAYGAAAQLNGGASHPGAVRQAPSASMFALPPTPPAFPRISGAPFSGAPLVPAPSALPQFAPPLSAAPAKPFIPGFAPAPSLVRTQSPGAPVPPPAPSAGKLSAHDLSFFEGL